MTTGGDNLFQLIIQTHHSKNIIQLSAVFVDVNYVLQLQYIHGIPF